MPMTTRTVVCWLMLAGVGTLQHLQAAGSARTALAPAPAAAGAAAEAHSSSSSSSSQARQVNTSWGTLPLFAHFRIANFTRADVRVMGATLRSLTVQGTVYGNLSGEAQAAEMREMLPATVPVFIYRNLYYSQPWDASNKQMEAHHDWQLKGPDGKPLNPEGKLVYNMAMKQVQRFYTDAIANLSTAAVVDGAFGDSGCGKRPAWLTPDQQSMFAQGQTMAATATQAVLALRKGLFIQNCPYLPHAPAHTGSPDPWPVGVRGVMYESFCSDFLTGVGGPGVATFCRDEILEILSGPAAWRNQSIIQARYYLSPHNNGDARFGAVAFMIAAFEGALFGASANWGWAGDFEQQSKAPWAREPLGLGGPPHMLDTRGCGWTRTFASGATAYVNLCFARGHPMSAHAVWADNTTWPAHLGAERAAGIRGAHAAAFGTSNASGAVAHHTLSLPPRFALYPLSFTNTHTPAASQSAVRGGPANRSTATVTAATATATASEWRRLCHVRTPGSASRSTHGLVRGSLVRGPAGQLGCLIRRN